MVKELKIKEIQKELPNMATDFYSELAKNYIYSEDHKTNNIPMAKNLLKISLTRLHLDFKASI